MSSTSAPQDPLDRIAAELDEFERLLPRVRAKLAERPPAPRRSISDILGSNSTPQFASAGTGNYRSR
jgi:hypothetical protein